MPVAGAADYSRRRAALRTRLLRRGLAAWMLVPGPNLRYFTGLTLGPSERLFLYLETAEGDACAIVPQLEAEAARPRLGEIGARLFVYRDETGPEPSLARALGALGTRPAPLGAEFALMRLAERAAVETAVPRARWHPLDPDARVLRQVKDDEEIQALRAAAAIARTAAETAIALAAPGRTERDLAEACHNVLWDCGTYSPFGILIASGPRSADPHAVCGDRRLEAGDLVWVDVGAVVDGYCGDVTRTVAVGDPGAELRRVLEVTRRAQHLAIAAARPGATAQSVDAAARATIAEAGLAAYFPHRTGHGLGLDIHEAPFLVDGDEEPLQPGMCCTVEPGVYLPGLGGARIEDDLLITAGGPEVLTRAGA